jgi:hypothetical protein
MADSQTATASVRNVSLRVSATEQSDSRAAMEAGGSSADHRRDIMFDANTAFGIQLLAAERSADDLRAARQYRLAKLARQRREATTRRTRLLRLVVAAPAR